MLQLSASLILSRVRITLVRVVIRRSSRYRLSGQSCGLLLACRKLSSDTILPIAWLSSVDVVSTLPIVRWARRLVFIRVRRRLRHL